MGNSIFFSFNSPASSNDTIIFLLIISNTVLEIQIPAGFASASNLAAILTASPKRLSSDMNKRDQIIFIFNTGIMWSSYLFFVREYIDLCKY